MKLGQILLHQRRIDRDQLREALRRQRNTGRPIGEILLGMGVVARDDVIDGLLKQPTAAADAETLRKARPEVAQRLPREISERIDAVLLVKRKSWACVAMSDPLSTASRAQLESILGVAVLPVAALSSDLAEARARIYAATASADDDRSR